MTQNPINNSQSHTVNFFLTEGSLRERRKTKKKLFLIHLTAKLE